MRLFKLALLFFIFFSFLLNGKEINLTETSNQFSVTSKSLSEFNFVNFLSKINTKKVVRGSKEYLKLFVNSYGYNANPGSAELPVLEELIIIPFGAEASINILNQEEEIISLSDYELENLIFPSQPSISKSVDAEQVPFYFNEEYYSRNNFNETDLVKIELLGKMRGQQLARLSVSPFKYNPTTNELKITTKIEVKINFKNIDIVEHKLNQQKYYSTEFDHLFKRCLNYIPLQKKDIITTYPVKYVIVADSDFQTALQPLIDWKTRKGFVVIEAYTDDPLVGSSNDSIHSFLKDMYDNATASNPAPTYLLIVGDDAQVPSFFGNTGSHLSDMYYCEFDGGGDFYPEMYYGRLSATNIAEVEVQVAKTLTYEKYTFNNTSFLDEIVLVAGVDASMATVYGNGQINYGTDNYFNASHGLTVHNYLYGSGTPITSDMTQASAAIISDISNGVGFANYTAHCGSSGWSDPSFSIADVSVLLNDNEFGLLIGNCCQSNKFDEPTCFGEALLRANDKGAVGYIGGSNNTYWDEDYWWAVGATSNFTANPTYSGTGLGAYDCLMHENGEQKSDWFITAGQMIHSGNLAVTQSGGAEQYYWEIYHLMGDPSLMPYIGVPTLLSVSHQSAIPLATTNLTVITEENAYVAISMNGILLDAQLADATGIVNLNFQAISNIGVADIVVTKQFKQPYIGNIQIISPTGPYVISASNTIFDPTGNNNLLADYNELIDMTVDLHNVGSASATSLDVDISTNDPYVSLINTNVNIPLISASQILTTPIPFSFQVASLVPDQHIVLFTLTITDNLGNIWISTVDVVLNSPVLDHTTFLIDDTALGNADGSIDAGETFDIVIDITNKGHADVVNLIGSLTISSPYISINTGNNNLPILLANGQQSMVFSATASTLAPLGTYVDFIFNVSDGVYSYNTNFIQLIGDLAEDYETGDFSQFAWVADPDYPWAIDSTQIHEGLNSSRSYVGLPDDEESELSIIVDVAAPGQISFWKFVSSELNKDELKFKINGIKVGEWSGEDVTWSYVSFPCNIIGQNEFKWEYDKSSFNSSGMDCAWIDYIVFPPLSIAQTTSIDVKKNNFKLFPNPTIGSFNISFNDSKLHTLEIYDSNGKIISIMENQERTSFFDLKKYAAGTYTIKVLPEEITYKIVKQ
tara:strand:- start:60 stop:3515 length:3456 start_codon:yes stop_codon:yes gene_type:complete